MIEHWRRRFTGASEYIGGVLVAVLLLPIVPDVAVDLFGASSPSWRNPLLRIGSLVVVVVLVLMRFRARERARVRAARGVTMSSLGQADALALALSPEKNNKPTYTTPAERKDHPTAAELLIDTVQPRTVFAVLTPALGDAELQRLKDNLAGEQITLVPVRIDDANDPTVVVPQITARLSAAVDNTGSLYVDVTAGTKAITLGMTSAAAALGAECIYIGSQFRDNGTRLEGTPHPYTFDPHALLGQNP